MPPVNDSNPRTARAETPPADHWQRWAAPPAAATVAGTASATSTAVTSAIDDNVVALPVAARPVLVEAGQDPPVAVSSDAGVDASTDAPYRILVVEDDRAQALFAQSVLQGAGMDAVVVGDAEGVCPAISRHAPDLILMALHLPDLDGMQLTAMIRQLPGMQMLPIVFLSADPDPERRFDVLDSGADDYLCKPIRPRHLIAAVSNRIRRSRAHAAFRSGAHEGPLLSNPETGLPTRHHVLQQLGQALADHEHGGLFFIGIGGAPGLRERHGHAAFERLMVQAGQRLAEAARPHLLARVDDSSFLALARGIDEECLDATAHSLREQLAMRGFVIGDEASVQLRGTIGFTALSAGFDDAGSALEAAERAALQARLLTAGVAACGRTAEAAGDRRLTALDGQLELAYLPIMAVAGGGDAQYQVLPRLRRSDGSVLTGDPLIAAAEAAGRVADLDQQAIEHALGLLDQHRHASPPLHLFVAQSVRTLTDGAYADWLLESLQQRRVPGNALVIDLRLLDALAHGAALQKFCTRVGAAGVRFCLSGFEPGAEANALLAQLPLAFVRMAAHCSNRHATAQAREELRMAIEAAHHAGVQTIGQPFEDPQTVAAMWPGGIDFIQGSPVPQGRRELDSSFPSAAP